MNRDGTGADHTPAALGFCFPESCSNSRITLGHATRMWDLVKAIGGDHGPNLNRLKQDLMMWVTGSEIDTI
jgi:hypothetical protein